MTCPDPTATPLADADLLRCALVALFECIRAGDREAEEAWRRAVDEAQTFRDIVSG